MVALTYNRDDWKTDRESDDQDSESSQLHWMRRFPLGVLLQKAGLISYCDLIVALQQQEQQPHLRLGEILAQQGWLNPKTAHFFAVTWYKMVEKVNRGEARYRLGESLEKAGLLNHFQIEELLTLQKATNKCFGELAIAKGYINEETLNLFIQNLCIYHHYSIRQQVFDILEIVKKLIKLREYNQGIIELRHALKINPHHPGIHSLLAIIYIKQKQFKMAEVHINKASRSNPKDPNLLKAKELLLFHINSHSYNPTPLPRQSAVQVASPPQRRKNKFWQLLSRKVL